MANDKGSSKAEPNWLIYLALLLAGILLLAEAFNIYQLTRWTARLGIGLVFSAVAMFVANGRWAGNVAIVIIWLAVVVAYIL